MAPTLRSSAPNTPSGKATAGSEVSTVTPRKTPVCSKCKRPRAGHPRSGCPYVESSTNNRTAQTPPPSSGKSIEDALGSMQLASSTPGRDEDTKAAIRNRRRSSLAQAAALAQAPSLLSLDSESQAIVERLLQPGMFDNDTQVDSGTSKPATRVVQWQKALLATPVKPKPKTVKMPGSLTTPSPESSQGGVRVDATDYPSDHAAPVVAEEDIITTVDQPPSRAIRRPRPLARSMSAEERDIFLSSLHNSSDATVYIVPRDDIHNVHAEAIKLGFYARIVLGNDASDPQGLVVLGPNEAAVKRLYEQVEVERKKSSRFRAAASGAVVGAVGALAGLAFS